MNHHLGINNSIDNIDRRVVIFGFNILISMRLAYMMIFILKRKIPWEESVSVPLAFAVYFIGFPLFVLPTCKYSKSFICYDFKVEPTIF